MPESSKPLYVGLAVHKGSACASRGARDGGSVAGATGTRECDSTSESEKVQTKGATLLFDEAGRAVLVTLVT